MAGANIKVEIEDREIREMLSRLAEPGLSDLMPRLGEFLHGTTVDRFKAGNQRAPDGTPWKALSPGYAKRKKANKDRVLTLNGYLSGGIRYQPVGDNAVSVGTNSKHAAIHQFGGTIEMPAREATVRYQTMAGRVLFAKKGAEAATSKRVNIAAHQVSIDARPFLGISDEDQKGIEERISDWIASRAAR